MKTLKFRSHLADLIMQGEKTVTWRLFDEKDLQTGDIVQLIVWETKHPFAEAILESIKTKTLGSIAPEDFIGHEPFQGEEEMLANYRKYYGDEVNRETEIKIINFKITKVLPTGQSG
jgi:hypothetical protein